MPSAEPRDPLLQRQDATLPSSTRVTSKGSESYRDPSSRIVQAPSPRTDLHHDVGADPAQVACGGRAALACAWPDLLVEEVRQNSRVQCHG